MAFDDLLNVGKFLSNPPPLIVLLLFLCVNVFTNRRSRLRPAAVQNDEDIIKHNTALHFTWVLREECVWECNAKGDWQWASPALAAMLGLDPQDMLGRGWLDSIETQEERQAVAHRWFDSINNHLPWSATFTVHNRKTGERFIVESRGWPCLNGAGNQIWHYGSFTRKHL